ncbi:Phosphatidylglycerophosphate synthase [Nocardioides sp. J9]|uniref:CDP-alcohol phosphatidyltransferase family protein n=1 Tax=unclassified Nocardioides TaxID=2615069 RepID=UPI00048D37CF|nr:MULTISPECIES: CDP-alcohol phosphatidyltransferase family protein [unclassified Nocardioides]TWG99160.1 Phosphatidylglycerophosphate synthase [Nocardioides sp. J9]
MSTTAPTRDIWTRAVIDPVADPLARLLAPRPWVTPNRVTAVSGVLGVAAAACLATGRLRLGGALFLLRFLADCLDGKVARAQRSSSQRGALLDVATDVVTVTAAYAALAWWAVRTDRVDPALAALLLGALGTYGWSLTHRKLVAGAVDGGSGSSRFPTATGNPLVDRWLRLCHRQHMRPVPWSVEAETLALGLLPLAGATPAAAGIPVAVAFYLVATAANLARGWQLAGRLDRREHTGSPETEEAA